ncbi:hypothetical protein [Saccharothrix sp. ST-888]|uniref:hypothetical protein n=1 Tax=Saccharothrix sp. ST-888 TaxID=1427391 RepID=UPI0012E02396|nr:hypothetical protein [Saccharothrix sp. ST-888]
MTATSRTTSEHPTEPQAVVAGAGPVGVSARADGTREAAATEEAETPATSQAGTTT